MMLRHLSRLRITRASEPTNDADASTLGGSTQSRDGASVEEGSGGSNDTANRVGAAAGEGGAPIDNSSTGVPAAGNNAGSAEADSCQALIDMGFDREQVIQALQASGGDVSDAVVALVSRGATVQEALPTAPAGRNLRPDADMADFDAVLSEALRMSEQEAEAESKLRADEQASLDAALAASLDCMGGEPSPPLTGLSLPSTSVPLPSENIAAPLPSAKGSKRRTEERHHSAPKILVDGDEKGDKPRHGARRGRRSSHEAPRRLALEAPEAPTGSFPSSPVSTSSLHSPMQARIGKLPPLAVPRHVRPVVPGGLDDRLLTPHRAMSKGLHKVNRHDELPVLSHRFSDARTTLTSTAAGQAGCRSSEEVIDLDEIENWSKGAAQQVRHPSSGAPSSPRRQTSITDSPKDARLSHLSFSRPLTRADPAMAGAGGSQPLRCPTAPKPGTAGASGSAFRAAVALSLS